MKLVHRGLLNLLLNLMLLVCLSASAGPACFLSGGDNKPVETTDPVQAPTNDISGSLPSDNPFSAAPPSVIPCTEMPNDLNFMQFPENRFLAQGECLRYDGLWYGCHEGEMLAVEFGSNPPPCAENKVYSCYFDARADGSGHGTMFTYALKLGECVYIPEGIVTCDSPDRLNVVAKDGRICVNGTH